MTKLLAWPAVLGWIFLSNSTKSQGLALLFAGILPVVAFTIIEEKYGVEWGTVAGMTFGLGELLYEKIFLQKISFITWVGNGLILGLGGISILAKDGIWFKMQPALLEFFMGLLLIGSWWMKKAFLLEMSLKQNPQLPDGLRSFLEALTLRFGIFFLAQSALATWAAFWWSTEAWAFLKGAGVTLSMIAYMLIEFLILRFKITKQQRPGANPTAVVDFKNISTSKRD